MMAMCEYANCNETEKLPVQVSIDDGAERKRFCCEIHAAGWLIWKASQRKQANVNRQLTVLAAADCIEPMAIGKW